MEEMKKNRGETIKSGSFVSCLSLPHVNICNVTAVIAHFLLPSAGNRRSHTFALTFSDETVAEAPVSS